MPWPHQLLSTLAPVVALTPTPELKSLWLTVKELSPCTPPDWMLEQRKVTVLAVRPAEMQPAGAVLQAKV